LTSFIDPIFGGPNKEVLGGHVDPIDPVTILALKKNSNIIVNLNIIMCQKFWKIIEE
jgi:hypothetical protein